MGEMTAFERQLASRLQRKAGPPRSVDAMAIARAATTTTRRWRVQTMFSATKFAMAAVIVALFGGFLLSGVLTQQPGDEPIPAAGASASPSPGTSYSVRRVPGSWNGTFAPWRPHDALWVPTEDGVARVDGVNSEVTTIPTSSEARSLVPTDDAIWAMGTNGVERIDRRTLTVSAVIARPSGEPFAAFGNCHRPIVADGSLWIAESGSHSLVEIDLASGALRDEYVAADDWTTEGCDPWMGATHDAIWVHSTQLTGWDGSRGSTSAAGSSPTCSMTWVAAVSMAMPTAASWATTPSGSWKNGVSADSTWATYEVTDTLDVGRELHGGVATPGPSGS